MHLLHNGSLDLSFVGLPVDAPSWHRVVSGLNPARLPASNESGVARHSPPQINESIGVRKCERGRLQKGPGRTSSAGRLVQSPRFRNSHIPPSSDAGVGGSTTDASLGIYLFRNQRLRNDLLVPGSSSGHDRGMSVKRQTQTILVSHLINNLISHRRYIVWRP